MRIVFSPSSRVALPGSFDIFGALELFLVQTLLIDEYLEYSERQTKTRTGAEPRNVRAVKPKLGFSFASGSPDRDPVFVY